jgi:hypothetical protein
MISDGQGGAIIVWRDQRSGGIDIYAQRINGAGGVQWTANGIAVCTVAGDQLNPVVVSDGSLGGIIAWTDPRNGSLDPYAQRISSAGVAQWAADGIDMAVVAGNQQDVVIASDGAGGAIAAWTDARNASNIDIYAQRINSAGVTQWTLGGVVVCSATGTQQLPAIAADGAAGAVIAWQDNRGANTDIYAHRISGSGSLLWPSVGSQGVGVCVGAGNQLDPCICWDNTNGAIIAWQDLRSGVADIYAQRVNTSGSLQWVGAGGGIPLCTAVQAQQAPEIVPDGSGGAVVMWTDPRNPSTVGVYVQRVDRNGLTAWANDGLAVAIPPFSAFTPAIVADQSGGAIVCWNELRAATDIYAQRIEFRYGYWGRPEPELAAVKDVPSDQGGKVRLQWVASGRDVLDQQLISHYSIWRGIDQMSFAAATSAGVPTVGLSQVGPAFAGKAVRKERAGAADYYWELIGNQEAIYRAGYAFSAETSFDSTAANNATHHFQVVAHASDSQYLNWPSNVLVGHSVDNLAPPAPLYLTALRAGGNVQLKWNRVRIPDLENYRVYRATATGVTPVPPNFLSDNDDTLMVDSAAPTSALYYIVTAEDVHGNEGVASNEAGVGALTGVGNLPPIMALTVLQNHPNPFTGATQLQIGLPENADVHVDVYDVAGRRVREYTLPQQTKGWSTVRLDSDNASGAPLASGVYFYRVRAGAETVTRKMVIAR